VLHFRDALPLNPLKSARRHRNPKRLRICPMPLDQIDNPGKRRESRLDEVRMSFGDHIEDLRRRLILALLGPLVASVLGLVYGRQIVGWLVRPLAQVLQYFGLPPQTYNLAVTTGFSVYMKVGLIVGLIISSPWVCYQLWKFIESGLYEHEKKAAILVAPFSALMSVLGVGFMYYVLLPMTLAFLIFFTTGFPAPDAGGAPRGGLTGWVLSAYGSPDTSTVAGAQVPADNASAPETLIQTRTTDPPNPVEGQAWIKQPQGQLRIFISGRTITYVPLVGQSLLAPMIEIGQYISFVTMLMLGVVVSFQLPVVMMILGWSGLIEPETIGKYRRYCVFVCFVLGALLTPADPISMFALALPLWGLFELGLLVMRLTYRKRGEPSDTAGA
jgi:sec-independent protein translocase protein TatC